MAYISGGMYHGFKLEKTEYINELKSTALIFNHIKSGARLIKLENDSEEKVFSIAFRTPVTDNTGVPHILEHSVLCGSRKFNTKEPFVDLAKGSLNTFLNAMTYPDKTMYPVASKNVKDFFNLMDVYLDAVFYPNIHSNPYILMQEGWHHELESRDYPIVYKGVVYNEMKGDLSSPNSILSRYVNASLFPGTTYSFESGGDPDHIPELDYEQFTSYHKKYYHPSNSYVFLYGNGDLLKELEFIDSEYLCGFDKLYVESSIKPQDAFDKPVEMTVSYPILENESKKDRYYFSSNFKLCDTTDPDEYHALAILDYLLNDTPASPLKKALLDADIAGDVFSIFEHQMLHCSMAIVARNTNPEHKGRFVSIINDTLKSLAERGIDGSLLEGCINRYEFKLREADFRMPEGLHYFSMMMTNWLYDTDPLCKLRYEETLKMIREKSGKGYFEGLIRKYFIDNKHRSFVTLEPEQGLIGKNEKKIADRLDGYKKSLSDEKIAGIAGETRLLKEQQSAPDSEEALVKIPLLSLSDISRRGEEYPAAERSFGKIPVIHSAHDTHGILYCSLMFETSQMDAGDIQYLGLLAKILTRMNTKKHDYPDISKIMDINFGGVDFSNEIYDSKDGINGFRSFLVLKGRLLPSKAGLFNDFAVEVLTETSFDDKKRFKEILSEIVSRMQSNLVNYGNYYARMRLSSYYSAKGKYNESINGLSFYLFLKEMSDDLEKKFSEVVRKLYEISKTVFNRKNLTVNVTSDDEVYEALEKNSHGLTGLPEGNFINPDIHDFKFERNNEGVITASRVQFTAKGYGLKQLGFIFSGSHLVLRTIVSLDYLWNKVRVQGGAYGASMLIERNGNFSLSSYRDPNLADTLKIFDGLPEFIKNFKPTEREMRKYIIGTIGEQEPALNPREKGEIALMYFIRGISRADLQKEKDEILSCTQKDINSNAEIFRLALEKNYFCVFGNESRINDDRGIFENIIKVEG